MSALEDLCFREVPLYILYVFDLNSTVCSRIVDVHLTNDQVAYDFRMDADLHIKSF